jgi:hypothetical protein
MWRHRGGTTSDFLDDRTFGRTSNLERLDPAAGGTSPASAFDSDDPVVRLQAAVDGFRASHSDTLYSAHRLVNPLLDLWSVAAAVDHATAAPIEALLQVLVMRSTTTAAELSGCMDEVEAVLARLAPV